MGGVYDEVVERLGRAVPGAGGFDFTQAVEGSGFLVESVNVSLPFWAGALPFRDGETHKERMLSPAQRRLLARGHARPRRGPACGSTTTASPLVRWELDDPVDRELAAAAHVELARAAPRPRRRRRS